MAALEIVSILELANRIAKAIPYLDSNMIADLATEVLYENDPNCEVVYAGDSFFEIRKLGE